MFKIGIVTHYYKSNNYGGNLQAYALCEYINKRFGYDAEQISYNRSAKYNLKCFIRETVLFLRDYKNLFLVFKLKKRIKAILSFNQQKIRHSTPFTDSTIYRTNKVYDAFITGSDQVWHPIAVCPVYLLDFVQKGKTKFSYAASLAVDEISDETREKFRKSLESYTGISVRENNVVSILDDVTEKNVECVLDPTLLLEPEDWDKVCEKCDIPEKFVFCYYLGDDDNLRDIASKYAVKRNLRIVTLPHIHGFYRECDAKFGDYGLYDVSPAQFITLIKNAETVFTDSFHASVFSIIYKKNFYVFERNSKQSMASRLYTLTEMFGLEGRFCDTEEKATIDYIESINGYDYSINSDRFNEAKIKSDAFLEMNLERVENEE